MPPRLGAPFLAVLALLFGACASRPLPKYEPPLARAAVQSVRTTAYTHSESDHLQYGARSAAGSILQYGQIHSAAADWSRWPNGTIFRIQETGEVCQVDDYGWALAGTNTIDLYKPDRSSMNGWGTRRVHIEIQHWGDAWDSYHILSPRNGYAHVKRMLKEISTQFPRGGRPDEPTSGTMVASTAPAAPVRAPTQMVSTAPAAAREVPRGAAPLTPFYR